MYTEGLKSESSSCFFFESHLYLELLRFHPLVCTGIMLIDVVYIGDITTCI